MRASRFLLLLFALCLPLASRAGEPPPAVADHVLLLAMDGVRWQEVFSGASADLLRSEEGGARDAKATEARFVRPTPQEAREALMPFLWKTVALQGQVFGDPSRGSTARATNGTNVSYPGYNEMLTGAPDPRSTNNDKVRNPNVSVLEWLNGRPGFAGRVEAVASWELFPFILDVQRSKLPVSADAVPFPTPANDRQRALNEAATGLPSPFRRARLDEVTRQAALETLRERQPRVLFVGLNDADEWGHKRRYDLYLDAVARSDAFARELWEAAQALPEYRGRTSLVIVTDHGRGADPTHWTDHNKKVQPADAVWMAVLGPRTPALGVREKEPATLSQVAATVAALVGEDWRSAAPKAAGPLPVLAPPRQ